MITTLDTQSWAKELVTGNAQFVEISGILYVVSNVRADNSFVVKQSVPAPPAPGPGATFDTVATYTFPQPNTDFDPVVAYDNVTAGGPYLHIIGTRNNPTNPRLSDLVKFTYNIGTPGLTGPVVLTSASAIRNGYDMIVLANGHRFIAVSVVDATMQGAEIPPLFQATITSVEVTGYPTQPLLTIVASNTFSPGQIVTLNGLTNATFLNGQTVQVVSATSSQFQAIFNNPNYGPLGDTGTATPVYTGENLLAFELNTSDAYVTGTLQVTATSPDRSGNTFSSVSLVTPTDTSNSFGNGLNIELYFEAHPKVFNFKDQLFTINRSNRQAIAQITASSVASNVVTIVANNNFVTGTQVTFAGLTVAAFLNGQTLPVQTSTPTQFTVNFTTLNYANMADTGTGTPASPVWDVTPTNLYTFTGRYTDDRLTVTPDTLGNRYLSQTFWTQGNAPEGITGNILIATLQVGTPWFFHPIYGSVSGGSFIQASISIAQNNDVTLAYLLQPFEQAGIIPPKGTLPSYPLFISTINPATLATANVPGFYNAQLFQWIRCTKSPIDNTSLWAIVGERSQLTTVSAEDYVVPASGIIQVVNHGTFWENVSVTYTLNNVPLVEVFSNPTVGQYTIEPSDGNYVFNLGDQGNPIAISYSYISSILPVYESLFNVPPIAVISPSAPQTVYRGQPLIISAAGTTDADNDPIEYIWSENYPIPSYLEWNSGTTYGLGAIIDVSAVNYISLQAGNLNNPPAVSPTFWSVIDGADQVTIVPASAIITPTSATLTVAPGIGGAPTTFTVGMAAVDLFPDDITPRHPALNVTAIQYTSGANPYVTFTVNNVPAGEPPLPLAVGETLMPYEITLAPPVTPTLTPVANALAPAATYYFMITYLNSVGESASSGEATITTASGFQPQVTSPTALGDAVAYNVYVSSTSGSEQLQSLAPVPLGTPWLFPLSGYITGAPAPTTGDAYETFLNDQIVTVVGAPTYPAPSSTSFSAVVSTVPAGYTTALVGTAGFAIPQFQYQTLSISVPYNAPPTITFPYPAWLGSFVLSAAGANSGGVTIYTGTFPAGASNAFVGYTFIITGFANAFNNGTFVCSSSSTTTITLNNPNGQAQTQAATATSNTASAPVARNTQIEITPGTITNSAVQLPVVYGGITDVDDVVTYTWSQVGGTVVTIVHGTASPILTFTTNGVNIDGENLVFQLILSDGVNPPAISQCTIPVAAYTTTTPDTLRLSRSIYSGNISQRNQTGTWGTLDISILYNNLYNIKRNSVNDGTDRYIVISPSSVLVYGGISPILLLLRKLFTPSGTAIVDAVHTEADYTIVIDNNGSMFRYSTAPLINTDDPDTTITLSNYTSFTFNKIFSTFSFANERILLLGGPDGLMLMLMNSDTFQVLSFLEISVQSNLLYGADNVQFFRTANVENLRSGQVLVGTVLNAQGTISAARLLNNQLTVLVPNNFHVGDEITLTGMIAPFLFLDGLTVETLTTTPSQFTASYAGINIGAGLVLTSVAASVGPTAVYSGTITGGGANAYAGYLATVVGFLNGSNNGTFPVIASTNTTLTLGNAAAIAETNPATVGLSVMTGGTATAQNDGSTFETLIDLAHGQIIGTWDASKLVNQFVNSGEILFDPQSEYSGAPLPPVQNQPTSVVNPSGTVVTISWVQFRPDLVTGYVVNYSIDGVNYQPLQTVGSGTIQSVSVQLTPGQTYYFTIQALSLDGNSALSNIQSISI